MYRRIKKCRICGNENLVPLLNLGKMKLSGFFPDNIRNNIPSFPLELLICSGKNKDACNLVQLKHNFDQKLLYNRKTYGYQSKLNSSMISHLKLIADIAKNFVTLTPKSKVIDIGSNDGTFLTFFPKQIKKIGIDPIASKFKDLYPVRSRIISDFFPLNHRKFKTKGDIIASIAMFYDLPSPTNFTREITRLMNTESIWILEQSYLPSMIKNNSFDTICHEHLEYYTLSTLKWLFDKHNLKIIYLELNNTNGGSILLLVSHKNSSYKEEITKVEKLLKDEVKHNYSSKTYFEIFEQNMLKNKNHLLKLLNDIHKQNKTVWGYGASTKGNILLQYCGINNEYLEKIVEVNKDKYGKFTPGTNIPIVSEKRQKQIPDYYFVLPWHFKDNIINNNSKLIKKGTRFIFPLPKPTIIPQI